jgi:hypothetical protein
MGGSDMQSNGERRSIRPVARPSEGCTVARKEADQPRRHRANPPPPTRAADPPTSAGLDDCAGRAPGIGRRPASDAMGKRHAPGPGPPIFPDGRHAGRPRALPE